MMQLFTTVFLGICLGLSAQTYNYEIDKTDFENHIYYLASDDLQGRKPGTTGDSLSAAFIRDKFREAGLELLGENGFQFFEVTTGIILGEDNLLAIGDDSFKAEEDFIPYNISANASLKADAIFVGYGFSIRDDTLQWDDYQSVDVQGKWVLVLRSDPDLDNPKSVFAESSSDWYKVMNAAYHGAAGVLLVNTVDYDKEDEIKKLRPENGVSPAKVPVIQIKRELADKILSSTNNTIEKLEKKFDAERAPFSFNTNCLVNAHTELELFKEKTTNVTGFLKGTSDTDDCLIFGAHYDHLGLGGGSSKTPDTVAVHYGADDNASGIAMFIELAQKASREKPERNLLFIAFGAEEMGLLGSIYYVNNPLKDLAEAKIMFNFDMVGRLNENNAVTVNGTGTAKETDSLLTLSLDSNSFKFIRSTRRSGISCRH